MVFWIIKCYNNTGDGAKARKNGVGVLELAIINCPWKTAKLVDGVMWNVDRF